MTPELVAILSVGVAILAVLVVSAQRTDKRFEQLEERQEARFSQIDSRFAQIDSRFCRLIAALHGWKNAWLT